MLRIPRFADVPARGGLEFHTDELNKQDIGQIEDF
jgi:hypothetical protein